MLCGGLRTKGTFVVCVSFLTLSWWFNLVSNTISENFRDLVESELTWIRGGKQTTILQVGMSLSQLLWPYLELLNFRLSQQALYQQLPYRAILVKVNWEFEGTPSSGCTSESAMSWPTSTSVNHWIFFLQRFTTFLQTPPTFLQTPCKFLLNPKP